VRTDARPALRDDLVLRQLDDELVVYDPLHDHTLLVNVTAAVIIHLCDGINTIEQIIHRVASTFSKAPQDVERDVLETLEWMIQSRLLEQE
jgi:hypothetical protein